MTKKVMSVKILSAAKEVFHKKGYPRAKFEDIVSTAGISTGEFKKYFKSKDDVCLKVLKSYASDLNNQLNEYDENINMRQRLSLFLDAYYYDAEILPSTAVRSLIFIMILEI